MCVHTQVGPGATQQPSFATSCIHPVIYNLTAVSVPLPCSPPAVPPPAPFPRSPPPTSSPAQLLFVLLPALSVPTPVNPSCISAFC